MITCLLVELAAVTFYFGLTIAGVLSPDLLQETTNIPRTIDTVKKLRETDVDTVQSTVPDSEMHLSEDDFEKKISNNTPQQGLVDRRKDISNDNTKDIQTGGTKVSQNTSIEIPSKLTINLQINFINNTIQEPLSVGEYDPQSNISINVSQEIVSERTQKMQNKSQDLKKDEFKNHFEKNISNITLHERLTNLQKDSSKNTSKDIQSEGAADFQTTTTKIERKDRKDWQNNTTYSTSEETRREGVQRNISTNKPHETLKNKPNMLQALLTKIKNYYENIIPNITFAEYENMYAQENAIFRQIYFGTFSDYN